MPIDPAPENWFTSFEAVGHKPVVGPFASSLRIVTEDVVAQVAAALDLASAISLADQWIAEEAGVTAYIVDVIDRHRQQWVDRPRGRRPAKKLRQSGRPGRPIAPPGSVVVPAYRCGDHSSVFVPCLVCHARNGRARRAPNKTG
jgi:hypothetical protein